MKQDIKDRLYTFVREALASMEDEVDASGLDDQSFLPELLDSVGLTTVLAQIEEGWEIEFEDDELGPEMFESIDSLATAVERKLG